MSQKNKPLINYYYYSFACVPFFPSTCLPVRGQLAVLRDERVCGECVLYSVLTKPSRFSTVILPQFHSQK